MAGCASFWTPTKIGTRDFKSYALPIWTSDGMYLVSGRSGALFLTPSPLDLSRDRAVVLGDIQIRTKARSRDCDPSAEFGQIGPMNWIDHASEAPKLRIVCRRSAVSIATVSGSAASVERSPPEPGKQGT
jgi:hypothetical protein